ncbi:cupredoxin domain-containing protein [Natrinema salaciae]|nr:plastocyanin/azurin family copper-binding protein [Natrinema salaciae]
MSSSRRRFLELGAVASIGGIAGTAGVGAAQSDGENGSESGTSGDPEVTVTARQEPGNAVYWVRPGPRPLSPMVFGTEANPRTGTDLLEARIEQASRLPSPLGEAVPQLLEELPFLVAAPDEAREPIDDSDGNSNGSNGDSIAQQRLAEPTLYSNDAEVTSGAFEISYRDHRPYDLPGQPGDTPDQVDLDAQFTDPAGNEYELEHDHVIQPPIPGYETGGGVLTGGQLHGISGTGSPLFPQVYTYGASWGVGHVTINGERATDDGMRVIHFMTTQTVRDEQYRMALDEEMPLDPDTTIAGQAHHTHGVVLPIKPTPDGPVYAPVPTAFELPNGETQPFVHAMWEQDEIVEGPFADWNDPDTANGRAADTGNAADTQADIRLLGEAPGWQGEAPDAITGTENPTLPLEEGAEYTLIWENGDGLQHNFAIEDETGEELLASEFMNQDGATQTVTFTASAEMAEYYCQVHPESMRGSIDVQ